MEPLNISHAHSVGARDIMVSIILYCINRFDNVITMQGMSGLPDIATYTLEARGQWLEGVVRS